MAIEGKKSKTKKILKIILIIFLLLLLVIFFGINTYVEGILKDKVDTQLNENPYSLYKITYDDLNLNILTGSVTIKKIAILPTDSAIQLVNSGFMRNVVRTHVEKFKVRGLKIVDFIKDKNVDISKVIVENTKTEFLINPDVEKQKREKKESSNKLFPNTLNTVSIDDFEFINATFLLTNNNNTDEYLFEIDSLSIIVKDVFLDSSTVIKPIPLNFSDININTRYFALKSMKYYSISTAGIGLDVNENTLTLNQFKLIPKFSRDEFNQQIKYNDDLFSINTDKVVFNGLSLNDIEIRESISLNSIVVYNPEIKIYRDKRLPDAPFKKKKLITSAILGIPLTINVDTVKVLNGSLTYDEMHNTMDQPGKVFFYPLHLTAYNITNDSNLIIQNPHLQVDVKAKIMGKSDIHANFDFFLNRKDDHFTAKGNLKAIDGTEFNRIVESLLMVKIESADVHSASFYFTANDDSSSGTLDLVYENLKAEVLKHKDPNKKSSGWTWIANGFIKKQNLPDDPKYRSGIIGFERRKDKAIVNFLWNSVKTGIISTIAPIADKNRKALKKEERETNKEEKKAKRHSKKTDTK